MFYSQFILAKKGPLGTIWIAAHLERKLRKNQVADTDIGVSVDSILSPDVPIALRLSSHLLLGVVRIYSKKVSYLFDDCSDALLKVKQAFRSSAVDLPPEESTAPYHSITLPETFDLDDFELPDAADIFHGNYVDHHVSSREQITLQDTMDGMVFSTSQFGLDERFGDGDTSGLDLDELDKLGQDADTTGFAQAPCTPGLAEEPNLSTAQETSVFDDHQELEDEPNFSDINEAQACEDHPDLEEDCNTTKVSTEENLTKVANNIDLYSGMENGMSDSLPNDENPVEAMSPATKSRGGELTSLDDVSGRNDGIINNDGKEVMCQLGSTTLEIDQLFLEPQDSNGVEGVQDLEKSCHLNNSVPSNESPDRCHPQNSEILASENRNDTIISSSIVHEKVQVTNTHVLQPCEHLNKSSAAILPEICSNEVPGRNDSAFLGSDMEVQELASVKYNHSAFCKSNDQYENVISMQPHPLGIFNGNEASELPEPEKLLSIPGGHVDDQFHLLESTPNKEHLVAGDVDDTGTNIICGKKRTFTESTLTVDSLNSVESLGVIQSKRTKESVPDDNDLLSSILVGRRYSVLKLKPTPLHPPQMTSKKRPRSTARISSSKRKVIVDDTMVLHGDQIRQQLTSTVDIRRVRKKAPCTRPEIWMIRKEYLDEEIFTEPIFTGFSSGLASMYNQAHDLNHIKLSRYELQSEIQEAVRNDRSAHADSHLDKETDKEVNHESILARCDMEIQSRERQEDKTPSESLPLVHSGETSEMHINEHINSTVDAINPSIVNGVESNFSVDPISVDKVNAVDLPNDVELNGSDTLHNQILETQYVEMDASMLNASDEFPVGAEADVSVATSEIILTDNDSHTAERGQILVNGPGFELVEASNCHAELLHSNVPLSDIEHLGCESNNFPNEMNPENVFVDYSSTIDHGDFEYNIDGHDTGFLNEDDDEITEEGEDCMPSAEHTGFNDNSGWSSRTRAVAKYLQVLFDKESEQGRQALPMNNLLVGKTRKEASRMFFEALVLQTRDYIQVEQEAPFENINMKPHVKLMKAEF